MNVLNIIIQLLSNPSILAIIKEIQTLFGQKTSAQGAAPIDHEVAMKQAVDEVVAKRIKQ